MRCTFNMRIQRSFMILVVFRSDAVVAVMISHSSFYSIILSEKGHSLQQENDSPTQ